MLKQLTSSRGIIGKKMSHRMIMQNRLLMLRKIFKVIKNKHTLRWLWKRWRSKQSNCQGYWFKNIRSIHPILGRVAYQRPNSAYHERPCRSKEQRLPTIAQSHACLSLMWKFFTSILSEGIYSYLDNNNLLPKEQKSWRKKSRGTNDQFLIDKAIIRNCKRRMVGLDMG